MIDASVYCCIIIYLMGEKTRGILHHNLTIMAFYARVRISDKMAPQNIMLPAHQTHRGNFALVWHSSKIARGIELLTVSGG